MLLLLLVISQDGQCEMDVTEAETVKWTQSEAKVVGVCRLPKTKTPWYLPYLHAFSPTRVSDPQTISGSWQELGPYCSQAKMSFLWPHYSPRLPAVRNVFMLEINAWKREKDLSHQQQGGSNRGAGKKYRQPNLYTAMNGNGVFLNPSNPTSLALFLHTCWPTFTASKNTGR